MHVFTDNGDEFANMDERFGFARHIVYEPCVHEWLSPNDNRLHGVKLAWRKDLNVNFEDDVDTCLNLMNRLDNVSEKLINGYFRRNFALGGQDITKEVLEEIMGKDREIGAEYYEECLYEYRVFSGQDARGTVPDGLAELVSLLDGKYWWDE